MDDHLAFVERQRINRTVKALQAQGFSAEAVDDPQALLRRLDELVPAGSSCSVGGSMTLFETGVIEYLQGRNDLRYLNRYAKDANLEEVFHQALLADVYIMSSNAITEDGQLYNVDGRGNRVAALAYGPKRVLVVAGVNKIVPDIEAARRRNQLVAAPANAKRLSSKTPCVKTGICSECNSPGRICQQELVTRGQLVPGRITVLLLPQEYGY